MMSCQHSLQFCDIILHDVKLAIHQLLKEALVDHTGVCTDTNNPMINKIVQLIVKLFMNVTLSNE